MAAKSNLAAMPVREPAEKVLIVNRTFDAPRALVYRMWTQPEHLVRWWGCPQTKSADFKADFRVGGRFRVVMNLEDGTPHRVTGVYRELKEPEKLVFTWQWEDADGNLGHETVVTVTLVEKGAKTELTLHQAVFETQEMRDAHNEGWCASFDRMAGHLAAGARLS